MLKLIKNYEKAWGFTLENQERIKDICKSLKKIDLKFFYEKLFKDGSFFALGDDDTSKLRFCYDNPSQFFINQAFLSPSTHYRSYLWPSRKPEGIPALDLMYEHDVWHGLSFFKKNDNYVEIWNFTTTRRNEYIIEFYTKNIGLLEQFINYFNEHTIHLREDITDTNKIARPKIQNETSGCNIDSKLEEKINILRKEIDLKHYTLKVNSINITFSKREMECLFLSSLGKSAREISIELNISNRTVEAYINSIKRKSNISTRSQLISILLNNGIKLFHELKR